LLPALSVAGFPHIIAGMKDRRTDRRGDVVAVSMLVLAALVVSWPILAGGYLTYADNPAHLAEIHSLASEKGGGWSDIAFCGFPIGTLHSPLWYGSLAALVRLGVPAGALYALALFVGFIAPSIAIYLVCRRYLTPLSAALIAYVFLVQWPSLVGLGSPLAGMWTYFLAIAVFVLLVERLSRGFRRRMDIIRLAILVGLIAITHLFPLVPLAVVGVVHLVRVVMKRSSPASLLLQIAAVAAGVIAAAAYWLPMALAFESTTFTPQNLTPAMAFVRLVFPADVVALVKGEGPSLTLRTFVGALPMWALIAGGVSGLFLWKRRKCEIALYGAASSVILAFLVVFAAPATSSRLFGPVSWRLLDFVRAGFALGTIPALMVIEARVLKPARVPKSPRASERGASPTLPPKSVRAPALVRAHAIVLALVGLGLAFWWGAPLRRETPRVESREMAEVRELWRWLEDNRGDDWGRVYIQDTFMTPPESAELAGSHVLSLTAHETGVRQLGPYYGVVPYRTRGWTMGQVGLVYGIRVRGPEDLGEIRRRMILSNATHLIVADPVLGARLDGARELSLLRRIGRFSVFEAEGLTPQWAAPLVNDAMVTVHDYQNGAVEFSVASQRGTTALVKTSYHPFWKLTGPESARLSGDPSGLIQVGGLPAGEHRVTLTYREPRWPVWVSLAGWLLIGGFALLPPKRLKRMP
jgi:hypothetical protein